jgi:hypothetical protein
MQEKSLQNKNRPNFRQDLGRKKTAKLMTSDFNYSFAS